MKTDHQRAEIHLHDLSVYFDGEMIMHSTVTCDRPKNSEELTEIFREFIRMHEAPEVPDPEVLGYHSPE